MRILVAQMTRMGDMLQSTPLISALRKKHPDAHVTVMVRKLARTIADHNPEVDDVILYDEDEMFLDLRAQDSDRLLRAYRRAEEYVKQIREGNFDVVYNCTNSISSAMLLKLAGVPKVVGADLSDDWQFVLRGKWVNYFFTSIFHRQYNDINLCDIFRNFTDDAPVCDGLVLVPTDEDRQFAQELLSRHGVGPDDFTVCLQLGASEPNKRWSEANFAALARMLVEQRKAKIFLLGVKEEARLGEAFMQYAPGVAAPLFGQTTVPQVGALLERSSALITNDTGTMHIAAASGCPIVLVSVGYVHFRETGPYGVGHCAVERRHKERARQENVPQQLDEGSQMTPRQVLRALEFVLDTDKTRPLTQITQSPDVDDVEYHVTRMAPDGCLEWYPVINRPMTRTDLLRIAYRAMWLDYLSAKQNKRAESESLDTMLRCYSGPDQETINDWRKELVTQFDELAKLAHQGSEVTEQLLDCLKKEKSMAKAKALVTELARLDDQIRLFGELHEPCKPLVLISRYERDNLEGADPLVLAKTTRQIYRDLFARARLTQKKIDLAAKSWRVRQKG